MRQLTLYLLDCVSVPSHDLYLWMVFWTSPECDCDCGPSSESETWIYPWICCDLWSKSGPYSCYEIVI